MNAEDLIKMVVRYGWACRNAVVDVESQRHQQVEVAIRDLFTERDELKKEVEELKVIRAELMAKNGG